MRTLAPEIAPEFSPDQSMRTLARFGRQGVLRSDADAGALGWHFHWRRRRRRQHDYDELVHRRCDNHRSGSTPIQSGWRLSRIQFAVRSGAFFDDNWAAGNVSGNGAVGGFIGTSTSTSSSHNYFHPQLVCRSGCGRSGAGRFRRGEMETQNTLLSIGTRTQAIKRIRRAAKPRLCKL